ncbi:MAG: PTS sugar transporter subunit IID [Bacteroidetes bacterium]|nr:MAG: PTS sugar transporter subunit IID [Bacteroidota bacterium]
MNSWLKKKNIEISLQRYGIDAMNAMALGLFGSLIVGLILKNMGGWLSIPWLMDMGHFAQKMMGPAIAMAIAYTLQAPVLVIIASLVVGAFAAPLGGPVAVFLAAVITTEFGKMISKTTPIDIIITPMSTLLVGLLFARLVGPPVQQLMQAISHFIAWSVELQPFIMGMVLAVVMGMLLTLPISSAAIAISLSLSGLAAGASTVGCAAQMIGFAVMSIHDNNSGAVISQGIGTSMLQMPNIVRNPRIWLPPIITSAILGPVATLYFRMQNLPEGAGMGTSGLVGQIATIDAMGDARQVYWGIALLHFLLPALLSYLFYRLLRWKGWIKPGDLTITT